MSRYTSVLLAPGLLLILTLTLSSQEWKPRVTFGCSGPVFSVAFAPDGKTLASGGIIVLKALGLPGEVKLWDVTTRKELVSLPGDFPGRLEGEVLTIAFTPDGKTLAVGTCDKSERGEVKLWDTATGKEQATLKVATDIVTSLAFSPDGQTMASGSGIFNKRADKFVSGQVTLWDMATGKKRLILKGHTDLIRSVAFTRDGKTLASGSEDKTVRLWDVTSGRQKALLKGHTGTVNSVAFTPDGKALVSGSADDTVKLWDVTTRKERTSLKGHAHKIFCVAIAADGKTLAVGGGEAYKSGEVKLWDLTSGKEKITIKRDKGAVRSLAFTADGKTLAAGSDDCKVGLWDTASLMKNQSDK